jgi:hypothetical protein
MAESCCLTPAAMLAGGRRCVQQATPARRQKGARR